MKKRSVFQLLKVSLCLLLLGLFVHKPAFSQEGKTVAILPFNPTFSGPQVEREDEVSLAKMMETDAFSAQKTLCQVIQENYADGLSAEFQDYKKTNQLLEEAGIAYYDLMQKERSEIYEILGVDLIIMGSLDKKIKSKAADITLGVLGSKVRYICNLYEKGSNEKLYSYSMAWKIGTKGKDNPDGLYTTIAKNVSRKLVKTKELN